MNNITKRMGELRALPAPVSENILDNVWVRGYGQQVNVGANVTGRAYHQYLYGTDAGLDKAFSLDNNNSVYVGAFAGFGKISQDFRKDASSGNSETYYGGLYATWLNRDGWYADFTAKAGHYNNNFTAHDNGLSVSGDYDNWGVGSTLEFGRKIALNADWFVTPMLQAAYLHQFGSNYATRDQVLNVSVTDSDQIQLRGGVQVGRTVTLKNSGFLQPYIKLAGVQQFSTGNNVTIDNDRYRPNTDGPRAEFGTGLIWQLDANNQLHLDYEASFGESYNSPWGVNFGYRYQF